MKRILTLIVVLVAFSMMVFAQGQRRGGPPPAMAVGERPDPTAALKNTLNLTDAQVESIKTLMTTRQQRAQVIQSEIEQKRQVFEGVLNAPSPNPADVGNAAIVLRAAEKKMQAESDWFMVELKKLLTADQQQTLDNLIAARTPIPGLGPGFGAGMRGAVMRRP